MDKALLLCIFCIFSASSCINAGLADGKTASASPTPVQRELLPVSPAVVLTDKEKKYLGEHLSAEVRTILEKASTFEILAEIGEPAIPETDLRDFKPNRIVSVSNEALKKEVLEAFYWDAAREDPPAICFEPHHSIRGVYQGKKVEIEICYSCSRYVLVADGKRIQGTIQREDRRSESLLDRILREQGKEIGQ